MLIYTHNSQKEGHTDSAILPIFALSFARYFLRHPQKAAPSTRSTTATFLKRNIDPLRGTNIKYNAAVLLDSILSYFLIAKKHTTRLSLSLPLWLIIDEQKPYILMLCCKLGQLIKNIRNYLN